MAKVQNLEDIKNTSINDIKSIYSDLENLLASVKDDASDNAKDIKSKLKDKITNAKKRIDNFETNSKEKAIHAYEQSRDYAKENPATTAGIVAAAGILIGLLTYKSCCKNKWIWQLKEWVSYGYNY